MGGLEPIAEFLGSVPTALHSSAAFEVGRWFLALVLLWSGGAKLLRPRLASLAIADYGVVRTPRVWQGAMLGAIESCLGVVLLIGGTATVALALASGMFLVFAVLIARSLLNGDRFACFCFGATEHDISGLSVARTMALALLALWLALAPGAAVSHDAFGDETHLALVAASGLLLTAVAISRVPGLLQWNRDVVEHFGIRARQCRA